MQGLLFGGILQTQCSLDPLAFFWAQLETGGMRVPGPFSVWVTHMPWGPWVQRVPNLRAPGRCSVLGTAFLHALLCSRICPLQAPGQPGIWTIRFSTTELGQAARCLRARVPMTPTVSSDVVTPCPRTYLFHNTPLCQVHGGTSDIVHMGVDWKIRAFMSPVLIWVGWRAQEKQLVPWAPQDIDSQLSGADPGVVPRGVGGAFLICLSIHGTDSQCPTPTGHMGICP